ncbi:MAG: hypothetical protein U1E14_14905 [Geminicoccaceae bacterium]
MTVDEHTAAVKRLGLSQTRETDAQRLRRIEKHVAVRKPLPT